MTDIDPEAAVAGPARVGHRLTKTFHVPGPKPPAPEAGRLRHYLVAIRDFEPDRYEGYGLTPERVIAEVGETFAGTDDPGGAYDLCIWEGDLVVAVVHSRGDRSYDVARIHWSEAEPGSAAPSASLDVAPPPVQRPCVVGDLVWAVTSRDSLLHLTRRPGATLEGLVGEMLEGFHTEDMAIWEDGRLAAFIRARPDGTAAATIVE